MTRILVTCLLALSLLGCSLFRSTPPQDFFVLFFVPGTTKLARLDENLGGATIELTSDEVQSLEDASSKIELEGARYSPFHQSLVGR